VRTFDAGGNMSDEDVITDDCFDDGQQHCSDKQPGSQFKHRVALLKFRARRWKHQAVLQVERNSWSRQYIWATSVLPTLFGNRRLVALRAIQTGLYRQYCPDFEKEENNKKMKMKLRIVIRGNKTLWLRNGLVC
jgi:hypothetical protein